MKAIIAEKPSVAREIASLLGADEKKDGYLMGNGYYVTWAIGHLVTLGMPSDYGITGFQRGALPILPDPFLLTVRKIKKDKGYLDDPGALKQLKVIEQVFKLSTSIIVATDAGREGELIFRYIYNYLNCEKPFERLWISSLTEKAINQGFSDLKPGNDFDGLFQAAQARSRADWIVGINATQALSIQAGNGIYSLGRVQTPTLSLICKRYFDNKNFNIETYWQIEAKYCKDGINFSSLSQKKWADKTKASEILKSIQRSGNATVVSTISKIVNEQPPLLFDLTSLQKEANKKLDMTAEETLSIAQALYEKKFITYPRTGSKYISNDIWPELPELVRTLEKRVDFKQRISHIKWGRFNKRIVNDLKVTDHHALLITDKLPSALSNKENAIYDMIAIRLLEAISHHCIKEITDIKLELLHYEFGVKGCQIIDPGWRAIKNHFYDEDKNEEAPIEIPTLKEGEILKINDSNIVEKKTRPPALFTEAGLLSAMETAGKQIEDEEERKSLDQIGIGTPATRAAIIEVLFDRNYIIRQKKNLIPTEKGIQVYELVKDKKISNVSMTAEWELAFQGIENETLRAEIFQKKMEAYAHNITEELLEANIKSIIPDLACPKCKDHKLIFNNNAVKCPDNSCGWFQFRIICEVPLNDKEIENLVKNKKTSLLKGLKSRAGNKFDAYIVLDDSGKTSFEFVKKKKR
ncbi:type IA DNA topoisomerase [Sphingobacterium sp. DR205]|uniref:type IA DNA topoisomerase n=1 Tax=Sphingobacterium sp. DR205 TaxID=2713573 RepID=UPI0013E417BE|nr:type IA DNA topoisomerase [Sphingobacterium sp. DR205]QIH34463.1 DNA topoisomerase III [Sphingobacterium sp. DR205]